MRAKLRDSGFGRSVATPMTGIAGPVLCEWASVNGKGNEFE